VSQEEFLVLCPVIPRCVCKERIHIVARRICLHSMNTTMCTSWARTHTCSALQLGLCFDMSYVQRCCWNAILHAMQSKWYLSAKPADIVLHVSSFA
jgi:hypothetical protein